RCSPFPRIVFDETRCRLRRASTSERFAVGVPQPVRGSDWGCPLQITGLNRTWRRPTYVFGIDGLQALHLAMKCADAVVESTKPRLAWLGEDGDLGMPKF